MNIILNRGKSSLEKNFDRPTEERDILFKEFDTLKTLYLSSESAVQSLFNFYMTVLESVSR